MTPLQALQILDELAGMVALKRADHQNVQTALLVVQSYIVNHEQPPSVPLEDQALQAERNAASSNAKEEKPAAKAGK